MTDTKVGVLINETAMRDAIHIAVAPVVAGGSYRPGEHVGFMSDGTVGIRAKTHIGIIDPFLKEGVQEGQRCWVFLYPQTVTGMRHHWTHPAFKQECPQPTPDWGLILKGFAGTVGCSLNSLVEALDIYADGSCLDDSSIQEGLNQIGDDAAVLALWTAYEGYTGRKVGDDIKSTTYFQCAC